MAVNKKEFPKRKDENCTSFYYILCGEQLKVVNEYKRKYYEQTRNKIGNVAAINLILLGK